MADSFHVVRFINENITFYAKNGTALLEAAREAGAAIETPCGASGICKKCAVTISRQNSGQLRALACRHIIIEDIDVITADGNNAQNDTPAQPDKAGVDFPIEISRSESRYGLAVDIGTTTLAAALVDMRQGLTLALESALNPQSVYAADVISRIQFASNARGLSVLRSALFDTLCVMTKKLTSAARIDAAGIRGAVFSGNPAMLHIALGIDPSTLGHSPYTPRFWGGETLRNEGLPIAEDAELYIPPFVSGFVGADTVSGLLASRLFERGGINFFIDIGTNGEMVLSRDGAFYAAAAAAGPAFEGVNITCGMRGETGAINTFALDAENCASFSVIGGVEPRGICGSAILDIASELIRTGFISKSGRMKEQNYFLTKDVYVSQKDICEIQLAKSAIRTGIELLLQRAELTAKAVDSIEIAGSFGFYLKAQSLMQTGILPPEFDGKVKFLGNTSLSGARIFLLNKKYRETMRELCGKIESINLASCGDFEDLFIENMSF